MDYTLREEDELRDRVIEIGIESDGGQHQRNGDGFLRFIDINRHGEVDEYLSSLKDERWKRELAGVAENQLDYFMGILKK